MMILTIFGLLFVLLMAGLPIFAAMSLASSVVLWVLEGKAGAVADAEGALAALEPGAADELPFTTAGRVRRVRAKEEEGTHRAHTRRSGAGARRPGRQPGGALHPS